MWRSIFGLYLVVACGGAEPDNHSPLGASGGSASSGGSGGASPAPARPFAAHATPYASGTIQPSGAQADLDRATGDFYDQWKTSYLRPGCGSWYVAAGFGEQNLTLSEANAFGLLISVLMAGYDPEARIHFDGLVRFHDSHPSANHPELMAWYQGLDCTSAGGLASSADADLDHALALLMADTQWGSCGEIDYRAEALRVIGAIAAAEVDAAGSFMLVGNELPPDGAFSWSNASRSADFMPDHFAAFAAATGAALWSDLVGRGYDALSALQTGYAPSTGLVPDIFLGPLESPRPAPDSLDPDGVPYHNDAYFYNAARVPWRVGTHAALGGARAAGLLAPLVAWFAQNTGGDPLKVGRGYALDGSSLGTDYTDPTMAFLAPLGVAAMSDPARSDWLDAIWGAMVGFDTEACYEDSVKLLAMLVMSHNWWAPESSARACP